MDRLGMKITAAPRHRAAPWSLAFGLVAAATLTACQNPAPVANLAPPISVEERYPIALKEKPVTLQIPVAPTTQAMTVGQRAQIAAFMSAYRHSSGGTLVVRTPSGTGNEVAALRVVEEIRTLADEAKVPSGSVRFYPYNGRRTGSAQPPVVLAYSGVTAQAAECGDWSVNIAVNNENTPYPNYGCSSQRNLAAMVSNPRDLETPRTMEASSAERRQTVRGKYILGEPTASQSEDSQSGTASTVGK
jgi:pilus assembly protein CpaD